MTSKEKTRKLKIKLQPEITKTIIIIYFCADFTRCLNKDPNPKLMISVYRWKVCGRCAKKCYWLVFPM